MSLRVMTARPHGRKVWEPKGALAAYGRQWPPGEEGKSWDLRPKFVPAAGGRRTGKWAASGGGDASVEGAHVHAHQWGASSRNEGWKEELESQVRTALKKGGREHKWWHEHGWATPVAPEEFTHRTSHTAAEHASGSGSTAGGLRGGGSGSSGGGGALREERVGVGATARGDMDNHLKDHAPSVDLGFDPPDGELPIVLDDFDDDDDDLDMGTIAWGRDMH